ncbi:MAG: hypothetical protein QNJ54_13685 [Prochloraceae cyanobacterium]|nr:hypothetical protein [Prochloraceae cyanobacterium]
MKKTENIWWIDKLGDWNPQLLREIKGRLKTRNIAIAAIISAIGQILFFLYYQGQLPSLLHWTKASSDRYCTGFGYPDSHQLHYGRKCLVDSLGQVQIDWQLWWLDLFVWSSIFGIFLLLVVGTYMLVADLSKEESRGTIEFIRMSPQSAKSILSGKILGVPILLYLVIALGVPLNFASGLNAGIPIGLILSFYGVLIAGCAFFYSAALLLGLVNFGLAGFKPWLGAVAVLVFLFVMTGILMHDSLGYATDWLALFYPGTGLFYLVDAASLDSKVGYLEFKDLAVSLWYGKSLFSNSWSGIGFILFNLGLWTYWIWQGLLRRFHNPISTVLSKQQSYWISGSFIIITLGFTLQSDNRYGEFQSLILQQLSLLIVLLLLTAAIAPHRQTLLDWARYRHQVSPQQRRSLLKDLIWGEKSPSTLALALCLLLTTGYTSLCLMLSPLAKTDKMTAFYGVIVSATIVLVYGAIAQLMLFMKTPKRAVWASTALGALTILPLLCLAIFGINPNDKPWMFLLSMMPMLGAEYAATQTILLSLLGQWLAIALVGFQMTKQLQKAGESETKALFSAR